MKDYISIAYCGLFCGACKLYLSTKNNTLEELSREMNIPVDLLHCDGCRADKTSFYCRNCAMKKCCVNKNVFSCNECEEFPCSVLKGFENDKHPHHKGIIQSLSELTRVGKDIWLENQKERWFCKNCNEPYSWYETKCNKCGTKINGL